MVQTAAILLKQDLGSPSLAETGLQEALERAKVVASSGKEMASFEAALALQSLLDGWQSNADISVLNLSIAQESVSLNIDARGDAQGFLRSLSTPVGWKLDEPRLTVSGDTTRIGLVFHPPRERGEK